MPGITLEATQKGGLDITEWPQWYLECLRRAFDGVEAILATALGKAAFWTVHANGPFNARQRDMINRLLEGFFGKLRSGKWACVEKYSRDTALRDINDLVLADRNDHPLVRGRQMHVMSYLRRLLLAKALAAPSNLLVLDEPTNDLDDALDLLQEALSDYDGTVLLVSHDRDLLDRLVTSTIALEGDGTAVEYAGGYSDYLAQRGPRDTPAAQPRKEKAAAPREEAAAKRLGCKRERALAELPKKMEALQAEIATLHRALADPDFYRRDASGFAAKTARLGAAQAELEAAVTEWLELEMLREELKSV